MVDLEGMLSLKENTSNLHLRTEKQTILELIGVQLQCNINSTEFMIILHDGVSFCLPMQNSLAVDGSSPFSTSGDTSGDIVRCCVGVTVTEYAASSGGFDTAWRCTSTTIMRRTDFNNTSYFDYGFRESSIKNFSLSAGTLFSLSTCRCSLQTLSCFFRLTFLVNFLSQ